MKQSDKREYWARSADLLQHVLDNGIDAAKAQVRQCNTNPNSFLKFD